MSAQKTKSMVISGQPVRWKLVVDGHKIDVDKVLGDKAIDLTE